MSKKLFKLSKYFNSCYCTRKKEPFIIKYEADIANETGIGTTNTVMPCLLCGSRRKFEIDTWWGGSFKDSDHIFLDNAEKIKFEVSKAKDMTEVLLTERIKALNDDMLKKKLAFERSEKTVASALIVLDRIKKEKKEKKEKKK